MTAENIKAEEVFHEAIEIADQVKRSAYLDRACGQDSDLRVEVEALLRAHEEAGDFLESPALDAEATLEESAVIEGPGTRIGRYEVLELIGEGGMGLVYLAEQKKPVRRRVALKIIKPGMDSKQVIGRFEAERQALALLDHPNIAHVFDAGTTKTGRPYFAMEYVKGVSITKHCDEQKLSIKERLKLFRQVCEGLGHAHQKGIIHRDIKPSNILVSIQDDKAVPKIIDFGIAKAITQPLTEKTVYTQQGLLLGTPEYMSPEQVDLATQDIDTRSDIYSLGVLLYVLLAGALPFDRESLEKAGFAEFQRTIQEEEPPNPSTRLTNLGEEAKKIAESRQTQVVTLARRLQRELEWIPLKAMRKDRTRRYRSASELADDIQNYLDDTPLIAGPETSVYLVKKFVRRHAGSVATAALVAAAIVLGLIVSTAMYFRAEKALQKEAIARTQAEKAEKVASEQRELAEERGEEYRHLSYIHGVALADAKYYEGNLRNARQLLRSCPEDLRNWEWHRLNYVMDEAPITFGSGTGVVSIAFSPDGKRIASGYVTITIWDAATGTKINTLKGHNAAVVRIEFSPDGKYLISGSMDGTAKVWDATSGEELMTLVGHEKPVMSVAFSPDGKRIVSGSRDQTVKVWDANSGEELLTIQVGGKGIQSVAVSPDGKRILVGKYSNEIHEWDATTGKELRTFNTPDQAILQVSYSPDGRQIALGCGGGMIKIVDNVTKEETILTPGKGWHQSLIQSLAFSPDSKRLVSGGYDRMVRVWDTNTGKELTTLVGHSDRIAGVAFSPDGKRIVSADFPGEIKIWGPKVDKEGTVLRDAQGNVPYKLAFSPDGRWLVSASSDKTVKVWGVSEAKEIMTLSGHEDVVESVAISPDGKRIVSGSKDSTAKIWDLTTGTQLMTLRGHKDAITGVVFSPDGKRIVSGSLDKTVKVWDAATGDELMILLGHDADISAVAYSPDGKQIVSGAGNGAMKIWDASTGEELRPLSGHSRRVRSVMFASDSKRIVSGSYDETLKIWDAVKGEELMILHGHKSSVHAVAFSPDGKRIVSGSYITAKIWDAATGTELMSLPAGDDSVLSVAFSPDGKTIAGARLGGYITLWKSGPEKR